VQNRRLVPAVLSVFGASPRRPLAGRRFGVPTLLLVRTFACQQCGHRVAFEADRCGHCASALGFLPEDRDVTVVDPAEGARRL
jgi:hypothetical protein